MDQIETYITNLLQKLIVLKCNNLRCCIGKALLTSPCVFQTTTEVKFINMLRKISSIHSSKSKNITNSKCYFEGPLKLTVNCKKFSQNKKKKPSVIEAERIKNFAKKSVSILV